jgi:hypothetical protein
MAANSGFRDVRQSACNQSGRLASIIAACALPGKNQSTLPWRYLIQAETSLQFKGCRIPKRFSVHPEVDDASVAIGFKGIHGLLMVDFTRSFNQFSRDRAKRLPRPSRLHRKGPATMKKIMICFSAGCLGALANSLLVWQFGELGIARWAGVSITPSLSPGWLYPRIVWGGLWGLLFVLPFLKSRFLLKGTLLSLLPTLAMLFFIFPYKSHKGMAGLSLGMLTPVYVLVVNWVWGLATAAAIKFSR